MSCYMVQTFYCIVCDPLLGHVLGLTPWTIALDLSVL